jgi:hypothetical protein
MQGGLDVAEQVVEHRVFRPQTSVIFMALVGGKSNSPWPPIPPAVFRRRAGENILAAESGGSLDEAFGRMKKADYGN